MNPGTFRATKWEAREVGFSVVWIVRNAANKDVYNILFEQLRTQW